LYGLGLGGGLPGENVYSTMPETYDPVKSMGQRPTDPDGARQWDINAELERKQFNQNKLAEQAQLEKNLAAMTPEERAAFEQMSSAGGLSAGGLMETGPKFKKFTRERFEVDPGYKFRLRQGLKALDRTASARGGLLSGGALKAAEGYGQELGSQEYGNAFNRFQTEQTNKYNRFQIGQTNQYNRLAALAGVGQRTAQQLGQAGEQYGQNMGNIAIGAGENQANALLAGANARGSMYQGIGQAFGGIDYKGLMGGGGQNADPWGRQWR
jgi:hypothetical protein